MHEPWLRERFIDYGELLRDRMALGALVSGADYVQALRRRRVLCAEMAAAMADLDILRHRRRSRPRRRRSTTCRNGPAWRSRRFTMPFNVTGYPAISVCTGFGEGGLPVAMQLVGKPFSEPMLFRAAHAYESAMPWRAQRPALAGGATLASAIAG